MDLAALGDATAKAQDFAHRVVEFADVAACTKFFDEKKIDFDRPNASGATLLMTVVARGRVDLIGLVMDRTTNVAATTVPNGTTVLHLAAMASNPQVIKELAGTDESKDKLRAIANACNRNGDTPLMMASVVKNAIAAKLLVEYLDASATPKNATGMTALMCASRLRDEREGPLMANESASIVSLLLAYGADVNAAEFTGRQTALHFALLSNNLMVVEQLLTIIDINLTARNKAGHSPLELARRLKLDGLIDAAVESQWQVVEEEAQLLSEQVAQELESVGESSASADGSKKSHKKKHKKKSGVQKKEPTQQIEEAHVVDDTDTPEVVAVEEEQPVEAPLDEPTAVEKVDDETSDTGDWVTATKKKPKRKESISNEPPQPTTPKTAKALSAANHNHSHKSKPKPKPHAETKSVSKATATATKGTSAKVETKPMPVPPVAVPTSSQSKPAPWSTQAAATTTTPPPSIALAPHTSPVNVPSRLQNPPAVSTGEGMAYDDLNAVFHRMFPIAGEMDIPVETFIAGADTRDARTLLDGLSVSQLEMLQEAHLQAYHYLNERKVEMARILEAERLEAQLQLRRQLFEMQ